MRDNCDILIKENLFCLYQNSEDPLCLKNIILYLHELVVIVVTSFFFLMKVIYIKLACHSLFPENTFLM